MDIFMRGIDYHATKNQVAVKLAEVLHNDPFTNLSLNRMNFHVHLHRPKKLFQKHPGTGTLTLPSLDAGRLFLQIYGDNNSNASIHGRGMIQVGARLIKFLPSNKPPRPDVLEQARLLPYQEPHVIEEKNRRQQELESGVVYAKNLQFGWECRDQVFSIECERTFNEAGGCAITFQEERREIRIRIILDSETYIIIMAFPSIREITAHKYLGEDVLVFSLVHSPSYQKDGPLPRTRVSYLPLEDHERVAPFTSLAIRLVCKSSKGLQEFRRLCGIAQLQKLFDYEYPIERRGLFSALAMFRVQELLRRMEWCIAFQVEALIRTLTIDYQEAMQLIPDILRVHHEKGAAFTASVLQKFKGQARFNEGDESFELLKEFRQVEEDIGRGGTLVPLRPRDESIYESYHVEVTPTTIHIDGPFPEQSNRVIRAYDPANHESFLRVTFVDEGKLRYRYDRESDLPKFIHHRVGPILLNGLEIAGRDFRFLAYSQSALKEHAVWFVKQFNDRVHGVVNANTIIARIGTFDRLPFDRKLIYCPARYAARISQAFTATDSVRVEVEEIFEKEDITTIDGKYQFTDGCGTLSAELAQAIHRQLKKSKGKRRRPQLPAAYQVRFMGSKGMLSIDHTLSGSAICIRPSMIKFITPDMDGEQDIEIARAFDRPGPFYLNRPLIMLLEGLGIPFKVFKKYQDDAVEATRQAASSIVNSARLLESHGLGMSFHLPSILNNLEKLYITSLPGNKFYEKMLEFSVNHILRDLKYHARIPIPGAWTLVGVADVHRYLGPDQVFVCIKPINGVKRYLQGKVLVSRSPVIHPGDVRLVNAIGAPPANSPFAIQPLANTVVFSVQGERPIPSCLGGGDLDGDLYNIIPISDLPEFFPNTLQMSAPASYEPAPKKLLDHPSTMTDVAEFFMDYISSDVVGIIAINWLVIADQSENGIFDDNCLELAALHSNAVDYPKSGQPVPLNKIPKLKHNIKPDWNAPETVQVSSGRYYDSQRAIGRLFREIDLPIEQIPHQRHRKRRDAGVDSVEELGERFARFDLDDARGGQFFTTIERRVQDFIWTDRVPTEDQISFTSHLFRDYATQLRVLCMSNTLSNYHSTHLSEAEAVIGTIGQKTSQPRRRKELISKLREGTDALVRAIRERLEGDGSVTPSDSLLRAWMAFEFAVSQGPKFGAQSFGWVALGAIFDAIKELEGQEGL